MLRAACPSCRCKIKARAEDAGARAICPCCRHTFRLPRRTPALRRARVDGWSAPKCCAAVLLYCLGGVLLTVAIGWMVRVSAADAHEAALAARISENRQLFLTMLDSYTAALSAHDDRERARLGAELSRLLGRLLADCAELRGLIKDRMAARGARPGDHQRIDDLRESENDFERLILLLA